MNVCTVHLNKLMCDCCSKSNRKKKEEKSIERKENQIIGRKEIIFLHFPIR